MMHSRANHRCWSRLPHSIHDCRGVVATEVALLVPVVLVGVMMLFELARVGLLIGISSMALDQAVQSFRLDDLNVVSADEMASDLKARMVDQSYGYLEQPDITVNVLHFDNLNQLGGLENDDEDDSAQTLPVWSVTVQIQKAFLTPLPEVLSLGTTFRYQYKHVFSTELNSNE